MGRPRGSRWMGDDVRAMPQLAASRGMGFAGEGQRPLRNHYRQFQADDKSGTV
jgi:hypothetical protein